MFIADFFGYQTALYSIDMTYYWHVLRGAGVTAITVVTKHSRGHVVYVSVMCGQKRLWEGRVHRSTSKGRKCGCCSSSSECGNGGCVAATVRVGREGA